MKLLSWPSNFSPLRFSVCPSYVPSFVVLAPTQMKLCAIICLPRKRFLFRLHFFVRWRCLLLKVPSEGPRQLQSSLDSPAKSNFQSLAFFREHFLYSLGLPPACSPSICTSEAVALAPFSSLFGSKNFLRTAGTLSVLRQSGLLAARGSLPLFKSVI